VLAATELEVKALHEVDASTPIVVAGAADLVAAGLAHSLAQPRGNVTGLQLGGCLVPKRLEILTELIPRVQRMALLYDRRDDVFNPACIFTDVDAAARRLSIRVRRYAVSTGDDLDRAFADMKRSAEAVVVADNPLMFGNRPRIVDLAARHRLPTIHSARSFVDAGAFASYGRNLSDQYRRAAPFVDRILNGAKPSELPVQQSMDFELAINMKTAKALRLTIPPSLLSRAERIGE
jgi:putative tryptophan/tyrosine transport system substrate-binding protein